MRRVVGSFLLVLALVSSGVLPGWASAQFVRPECTKPEQFSYGICVTTDMDKAVAITKSPAFQQQFNAVVAAAKARLDSFTPDKQKVAVFDLDETLLSNLDFYARYKTFNPTYWDPWVSQNKHGPYNASVLELVKYAKAKGFSVMFLTGRTPDVAHDTLEQMQGLTWDGIFFRCGGRATLSSRIFKTQVHEMLKALGYEEVLNMGDQASDLQGPVDISHNGEQAKGQFLLPNVIYTIP